jgi:hypothetical protein
MCVRRAAIPTGSQIRVALSFLSFLAAFGFRDESFLSQPGHHWRAAGMLVARSRRMRW